MSRPSQPGAVQVGAVPLDRATCTPAHRATRTTHGGTACGPCWEAAIRADATAGITTTGGTP